MGKQIDNFNMYECVVVTIWMRLRIGSDVVVNVKIAGHPPRVELSASWGGVGHKLRSALLLGIVEILDFYLSVKIRNTYLKTISQIIRWFL